MGENKNDKNNRYNHSDDFVRIVVITVIVIALVLPLAFYFQP